MLDTMPLLRELSGKAKGYPWRGPAGLGALGAAGAVWDQTMQGEMDAAFWRNLNLLGGNLFHYPARAMNEFWEAGEQVFAGEIPTAVVGVHRNRR